VSTISKQKRTPLILFGGAVVILFAAFAIFNGLGNPSVPGDDVALVQDAPSDLGDVSKADFDRALQQTAARSGVKAVPKPGSAQYEQIKQGAMNDLLDRVWIEGEAKDLGVTATPDEVSKLRQQTVSQNFRSKAEFEQFLKQSHFTAQDIRARIKLQILSNKIQQQVLEGVPAVTPSEISEFYNEAKAQFVQPATRDVRLILNKDQAKVEAAKSALEGDSSDASWQKIAAQYSTDASSKANGGLRPSLSNGLLEQPLNDKVFAAGKGEIVGPVKTPLGYYVFEVVKTTPGRTVPLNRSTKTQIQSQLSQQRQQDAFSQFVNSFGSKWRARTFCASGYVIDRCNNFRGGRPTNAPAACYEAHPKGGIPEACPAPAQQVAPALPGTISLITPQGTRLPQRPIVSAVAPTQAGLGGALPQGSVPQGAAPTTGTSP
jgi:foldase protein PrsA